MLQDTRPVVDVTSILQRLNNLSRGCNREELESILHDLQTGQILEKHAILRRRLLDKSRSLRFIGRDVDVAREFVRLEQVRIKTANTMRTRARHRRK